MRYLLDTNVLLWYLDGDSKLKKTVLDIIDHPKNDVFASVINYWEISIKNRSGKLPLKTSFKKLVKNKFRMLNVQLDHVFELHKLENIHKDPFDRLIISQAKSEKLTLITSDKKMVKYKVKILMA